MSTPHRIMKTHNTPIMLTNTSSLLFPLIQSLTLSPRISLTLSPMRAAKHARKYGEEGYSWRRRGLAGEVWLWSNEDMQGLAKPGRSRVSCRPHLVLLVAAYLVLITWWSFGPTRPSLSLASSHLGAKNHYLAERHHVRGSWMLLTSQKLSRRRGKRRPALARPHSLLKVSAPPPSAHTFVQIDEKLPFLWLWIGKCRTLF